MYPLYPECAQGHPYDKDNTGRKIRHGEPAERFCKTCARARSNAYYHTHK